MVFRSLKFHAKFQDFGVKREAFLKMRNTQFWDKGIKVHSVLCSLFRNDMQVVETLFSYDTPDQRPTVATESRPPQLMQNRCCG
jgi:hypothetical protein